jgi:hypothetical protein
MKMRSTLQRPGSVISQMSTWPIQISVGQLNDVGKPGEAVNACNSALKLNPEDGETFFLSRSRNDLLNKPAEATRLYKRAVAGLVHFTKANLRIRMGIIF